MQTQPQPKNFRPAGRILLAQFAPTVPEMLLRQPRYQGARADGVRYERKAKVKHETLYGERFVDGPWLSFLSSGDGPLRFCQPDALVFDLERLLITVLEYKLSHTDHAWWQLNFLYIPVVQFMFPNCQVRGVEVCKWFDPGVATSAPISRLREVEDWHSFSAKQSRPEMYVHILKA